MAAVAVKTFAKPGRVYAMKKQLNVERAKKVLLDSKVVALFHKLDCTAEEWLDIRATMAKSDLDVAVLRNKISRHVLVGTPLESLHLLMSSSMAVVYGNTANWPAILALGKHPKLSFNGAKMDSALLGQAEIAKIMTLPDIDTLRAELLHTMLSPVYQTQRLLSSNQSRLSQLLGSHTKAPDAPAS